MFYVLYDTCGPAAPVVFVSALWTECKYTAGQEFDNPGVNSLEQNKLKPLMALSLPSDFIKKAVLVTQCRFWLHRWARIKPLE